MQDTSPPPTRGSIFCSEPTAAGSPDGFSIVDTSTWPFYMTLDQVAAVLRFKDTGTVRRLTNEPVDKGGLPYVEFGTGKRKTRRVKRDALLAYIDGASVHHTQTPPLAPRKAPARKKAGVHTGPRNLMERFGKTGKG